ncbi:MAG: tetratricopeptide repeat protein [Cyclonatronaceae bacterium]
MNHFEQKLNDGISAFYRLDWDKARNIFTGLQDADYNDPRPYFFEAMVPFWQYFFAGEDSDAAEQFLSKSEKAIAVGKKRMDSAPEDTTTVLMMGGLYGYRGLVAASERHYRTAIQSGTSGLSFTRRLMRMSSDNPDVLIGQGVFNYMVGTMPREARWVTSLAGLSGNREVGLEKLEEAAERDTYTSTDARMILAYLYVDEELYDDALRVVKPLVDQWPENIIFRYYYALSLEKNGQKKQALSQYRLVVEEDHPELQSLVMMGKERLESLSARAHNRSD